MQLPWVVTSGISRFVGCTTLTQVMDKLFGKFGKNITLYAVIMDCIMSTSSQALIFGAICNYFFKIELWQGIVIGIVVINIYSILGGFRGIIAIDVFQFLVFFLIIPISYIVTIQTVDFTGNFINSISISSYDMEFNLYVGMGLLITALMPELGAPFTQRYLMLADNTKALKVIFKKLFMIAIPFIFSICLIAYLTVVKSGNTDLPSNIIFNYIGWLPLGIKGLMISGIFAILMSTADSHMNATSAIISNDFIKHYYPKIGPKKLLLIIKCIILLLSLFPLVIVLYKDMLFQVMIILRSLGSNILVVPLSACLLGFNVSRKQFLYSLVSSVLFMSATILLFDKYPLLFMFLGSLGSFVGLICNRDAYKGFVRGINRLYPLFCEVIVNLSSKIQKLKKEYIRDEIDNTVESKSAILNNFSLFIFSYYFVFSLYIDNTKSLLPYLIMIGYALVLVFMLREILFPEKLVIKYSNIYYYICLTFCLPLVSSYLLFYYTAFGQESNIWLISSLLTTFLLYQFLNATIFVISMTIGFILGCILYMIEANTTNIGSSLHLILYIYLSFLFISQIIAREKEKKSAQKDKVYKEKLSIIQVFSEMIVHEVKTPISITSMQSCLFQTIIENIEKNQVEEGFIMKRSHYKALKNATFMLEKTSQHGLNTIDNLVTSLKGAVGDNEKQVIFIKDVIEKSIKEYILYIPEIKNIKLKIIDNFKVKYSFNSVKHIIINLIKNSCIHNGYGVTIEVRAENNQLSFKDYGKGIKKEIREKIFEKFFTESKSGTGIGLSFCKIIMHDIGGSIRCESVVGEYTNFILEFPKHHEKNLT